MLVTSTFRKGRVRGVQLPSPLSFAFGALSELFELTLAGVCASLGAPPPWQAGDSEATRAKRMKLERRRIMGGQASMLPVASSHSVSCVRPPPLRRWPPANRAVLGQRGDERFSKRHRCDARYSCN